MAEEKVKRQKAKSKGFSELGVPVGAILSFRKDPSVTCTVLDGKNKVEYQGKSYPISGLAKELMKTSVSGYQAFLYEGTLLAKLGEPAQKPQQAPTAAPGAVQTQAAGNPQTVPIPSTVEASTNVIPNIDPLANVS